MTHCCEAPRFMLSNYFGKKQVLRVTFWEIWCIQIQMYPKSDVELKSGYLVVSGPTKLKSSSPFIKNFFSDENNPNVT